MTEIKGLHLDYLSHLLDWRILDLKNLMEVSKYDRGYNNFTKIIARLKLKNIIETYSPSNSRKIYIYLTEVGEKLISKEDRFSRPSQNSIYHDLLVSEICYELLKLDCFNETIIEHKIHNKKEFLKITGPIPDAILKGEIRKQNFRIALELELHQKSKDRIFSKASQYMVGNFDYVIYIFNQKAVFNNYLEMLREKFGEQIFKKIILFSLTDEHISKEKLLKTEGYFDKDKLIFEELFH